MKVFVYCLLFLLFFVSCGRNRTSDASSTSNDTLQAHSDSTIADSVFSTQSHSVDGLFDDFIYSFMHDARFQTSRIAFPLISITDSVKTMVERTDWKHDALYNKQDVYTMIFDDAKSVSAEKDTALCKVIVEKVDLTKQRVKQYFFNKEEGQWKLTELNTQNLSAHSNYDFYNFYRQFATKTNFQLKHISNPFRFKTYDADNFQDVEGVLDVSQWTDFRPQLPRGTIYNINYGQTHGDKKKRILMICSPSGGMGCALTFVRSGRTWKLDKLEN